MSESFGEVLGPGKYIVAVSGGVDSVVLLDVLSQQQLDIVVAHFDHGMRDDSNIDCDFVAKISEAYGFVFEHEEGNLGDVSETEAREARYKFLNRLKEKHKATAIVTAHHKNDVVETLILNILRGTGRRGLSSLRSDIIKRPLLHRTKAEILDYAKIKNLEWREDPTNKDIKIARNYIRNVLIPKMEAGSQNVVEELFELSQKTAKLDDEINDEINDEISKLNIDLNSANIELSRYWMIMVGQQVGCEVIYEALKKLGSAGKINKRQLRRTYQFCKTGKLHKAMDVHGGIKLEIHKSTVVFTRQSLSQPLK